MMRVSAIIPTYNRRPYLARAIDSVLRQTVAVDELIVIDDGSTDGTAEHVTAQYGSSVRLIRQENGGVSAARRRGIQEAQGEWIAFLDSDDEWMPERNGELLKAAEQVPPDVAWIFGDLRVITDEGEQRTLFEEYGLTVQGCPEILADAMMVQFPFQFGMLQGSFIRRSVLLELSCFTTDLLSDDDLLAGFQVACRYRYAAIPVVVGKYFRTSDLDASSVVVNGVHGPDYYRARMLAFEAVVQSGRKRPWNKRYASEARGLCQVLAARRLPVPRSLVFEQFRFGGLSIKGAAFACVGIAGPSGIRAWNEIAEFRRKLFWRRSPPRSGVLTVPTILHRQASDRT
jgi:glycosyltransferase involved in cell wall biosynthesis